jgi:hypothetical protein
MEEKIVSKLKLLSIQMKNNFLIKIFLENIFFYWINRGKIKNMD